METHIEDLTCPITLECLEVPITLPCCGRAVSKLPLIQCLENSKSCPLCRHDLSAFDVINAPVSVNLSYMIEKIKNESMINSEDPPPEEIKIRICRVAVDNVVHKNVIGQLQLTTNTNSLFKHLFIIVVDKSGSMSGNPMTNVRYSLNRIIDATYKYSHLITQIITYDDRSTNFEINRTEPMANYCHAVNNINGSGGTSFTSAFQSIKEISTTYMQNPHISSVSILFLTDGEDSSVSERNRGELVDKLKIDLDKIIKVSYTVHTVGFGGSHDFNFLNRLKDIGTNPGAYRYANPSESTDILSSKINSILDVIVTANVTPIEIIKSDLKLISSIDNNKCWVNLTGVDLNSTYQFTISINNDPVIVTSNIVNLEEQNEIDELKSNWYTYLIDEIATEVLSLSNEKITSLDKSLHCELIRQRSKAILVRLDESDPNKPRCEKLLETLELIKTGGKIDQLKLTDMKYEGKYATAVSTSSINPVRVLPSIPPIAYTRHISRGYWNTIQVSRSGRCVANKNSPEIFRIIAQYSNRSACNYICPNDWDSSLRPLIVASSVGRQCVVEKLIEVGTNIDLVNDNWHNATDVAILYGYWKTLDVLVRAGGKPSVDGNVLLQTCISNGYYNTAEKLLEYGFAVVTDHMLDAVPNASGLQWLSSHSKKDISIEIAIEKGAYDQVVSKINSINMISWKPYVDIFFTKPTENHIKIIRLLLENGKVDANETWDIIDDVEWPLFVASKNGLVDILDILLEYQTADTINKQNKKGTTALWIASCNKHIDIVMKLLIAGANPNLDNFKGDGPLIPCCQKGSDAIATLLLESGANLNVYNSNRDNPVIICCRVGQAKILDIFLKRLDQLTKTEILLGCADIDGFNPLLAAAEQDRAECIKVCITHGADIEFRTSDQNQILAGATAIHIASYYGKLNAVKTLCELGANPLAQTTGSGLTILHLAIKQSHRHIVEFIMSKYPECTSIPDVEGKLPVYYAKMTGNESIAIEFFTNGLENLICDIMCADSDMEKKCADILLKYGQSIGCYEFNKITQMDIGQLDILSMAILGGNQYLTKSLLQMNLALDQKINPMALFWGTYTKIDGFIPDDHTIQMTNRVRISGEINIQNKMLMNLGTDLPKLLSESNNPTQIIKMSNGYEYKVDINTISLLKKSQLQMHSLLGFIEKLKNSKMFSGGKSYVEYILYESKIHMIKLIAEGELLLQPIHLIVLYLYTMDFLIYQQVNSAMSNWTANGLWHPFVHILNQAIDLIPVFNGEVYRSIDYAFDPDRFVIGTKISFDTFATGSSEWGHCTDLINKKKGMIFIIKSKTGRPISSYSKYPANSEIIFVPGTEFTVTELYVGNIFVLGQANIRKTSYMASMADMTKAMNSEMCMIIELEEN